MMRQLQGTVIITTSENVPRQIRKNTEKSNHLLLVVKMAGNINLFHNGGQIKYSFVLMPISLSNLAVIDKVQKNI